MNFLGLIPLRWWIYIAATAAIAGVLWHDHHVTGRLRAEKAANAQLEASYNALQASYAHERKIATEASNDYERRLKDIQSRRADTPTRSVRLCREAPRVPGTSGGALGTAAGTAGEQPAEAGHDLEVSRDVGPDLYALADEADERAAQCNALIKWVRSR